MLTPPAYVAAPASRNGNDSTATTLGSANGVTLSFAAQYVRYARLPCKRVPGPPIISSSMPSAAATSTAPTSASASANGSTALVARAVAGPVESLSSPVVATASPAASPVAPTTPAAGAAVISATHSTAFPPPLEKAETPFQAAQQFFASSGASLLHFANPSFYLTVRNTLEGGHAEESGGVEELTEAAQDNLLASPAALAALKERYGCSSVSSNNNSIGNANANVKTSHSSVDWKKIAYVRQQCRYTGKALVASQPPQPSVQSTTALMERSASTAAPPSAAEAGKTSVGARLMQSLLHPFVPSSSQSIAAAAAPATAAAGGTSPEQSSTASEKTDRGAAVPHGDGVMTYVLYAMPKPGHQHCHHQPPATPASPASASVPGPFLPPTLIPTAFCPALAELEDDEAHHSAASPTVAESDASGALLLALVVYEGPFVHGRRHGRGRLTAYGRFVLECTWVHDVPCLAVPRGISATADPSLEAQPTLRRIQAHVRSPTATGTSAAAKSTASLANTNSIVWSLRTNQTYMGSLALATVASKRLLARLESAAVMEVHGARYVCLPTPPLFSSLACATDPAATATASADGESVFSGLAWVNDVVLLPDGFGEAHYYHNGGSAEADSLSRTSPAASYVSASSVFHPWLFTPESLRVQRPCARPPCSPALASALCTQYCGSWVGGLPHGFGVELERITDPTCAPLSLSSATAGAGPPQYPWHTLFLGKYERGERRGPGTYHGLQGSEATEVVVCGIWPRTSSDISQTNTGSSSPSFPQEFSNVVLLPAFMGHGRGNGASSSSFSSALSSFFTLQSVRWAPEEGDGDGCSGGDGGGGAFPSATLCQSPAALSGMWEPLFYRVDELVNGSAAQSTCSDAADDAVPAASPSSTARDVVLQSAQQVMDHLTQSPECVSALLAFQACFACIYGCDTAGLDTTVGRRRRVRDPESPSSENSNSSSSVGSTDSDISGAHEDARRSHDRETRFVGSAAKTRRWLLARLRGATAAVAEAPLGYPWCPLHSWCGLAHLRTSSLDAKRRCSLEQHYHHPVRAPWRTCSAYTACLHMTLCDGATHHNLTARTPAAAGNGADSRSSSSSNSNSTGPSHRPPLSAVTAALEPYAAAHTFSHAMHAAAAMVSSLRLRLLSCFAAYPDLCEVVMAQSAHESTILAYCWDLVYRCVGPILQEKATAVAVADVRMVWDLLGLDRVRRDEQDGENNNDTAEKRAAAEAAAVVAAQEVVVRSAWQPEGKETLRDFRTALRRCRTLTQADMVDMSATGADTREVQRCAELLAAILCPLSRASDTTADHRPLSLQDIVVALQELHVLLCGAADLPSSSEQAEKKGGSDTDAADVDAVKSVAGGSLFTPAQREAMLRWMLLAASDPATHLSLSSQLDFAGSGAAHVGHPFALLLIASYVLGGRITPSFPASLQPLGRRRTPQRAGSSVHLLRVLKDLGYAARQLLHTYPSLRVQTFSTPLVCPAEVVFAKLAYALSPCAAHYSLSSSSSTPPAALTEGLVLAQPAFTDAGAAFPDHAGSAMTCMQLDQLPVDVLQWCNEAFTDSVTENLLQTRLHRYWSRWAAASVPAPPSPLVRWVMGCLQGVLSAPVREVAAQQPTTPQPSPASPSPPEAVKNGCTWRRFINAVFFTPEEKREWTAATGTPAGTVHAVSAVDYVYLVALAYTLRELSGLDLSFTAQFVLQGDDDDDDEHEQWGLPQQQGTDDETNLEGGEQRSRKPRSRSAGSLPDRKKNIFLSSSESSQSSVSVSRASSPPVEAHDAFLSTQAAGAKKVRGGGDSTGAVTGETRFAQARSAFADAASPPSPPPQHQRGPSAPTVARTSPPGGYGRQQRGKRGPSALLAESTTGVVPMGKEWMLTVQRGPVEGEEQGNAACCNKFYGNSPPERGLTQGLLWELMEQACTLVEHHMQETKPTPAVMEGGPLLSKAR